MELNRLAMYIASGIICSVVSTLLALVYVVVDMGEAPLSNPVVVVQLIIVSFATPMAAEMLYLGNKEGEYHH